MKIEKGDTVEIKEGLDSGILGVVEDVESDDILWVNFEDNGLAWIESKEVTLHKKGVSIR
ncbi:TPA: hypothetical protein QCQ12_003120 [Bacillus cereus biovar anthracis]|nr:hypothetical protein [Bacillus cereus biovar anthracis]